MTQELQRFARFVFADAAGVAVEVDQNFHYAFRVDKSSSRDPDTAEVTVFNLKRSVRERLATDVTTIEIYAGNEAPPKLIFKGEVTDTVSARSDDFVDWIPTIYAEDSKSTMRTRIVARTFAAGASLLASMLDVATAAGMQLDAAIVDVRLPSAMSFLAPPKDCLFQLCQRFGLRYQIVDGRVVVRDVDAPVSTTRVPVISKLTGLKGVPTSDQENRVVKVTFRTMLDAALVPGGLCVVQTESTSGSRKAPIQSKATYWIERVVHTADATGDFTSECVCRRVV